MSFADYMDSLGARQVNLTGVFNPGPNYGEDGTSPYSGAYKAPYNVGDKAAISPYANSNNQGLIPYSGAIGTPTDPRIHMGANGAQRKGYAQGFVDSSGGFLGYGTNYNQLQSNGQLNNQYANYTANEPGRLADVEAKNIANQRARLQYEQDYQAAQAAKLAAQAQQPHFGGAGLTGLMGQQQSPQQGGYGRGSGFAPGQQYTGGAGRGSGFAPGQQYAGGMGRGAGQGLLGGMGRGGPIGGVV